MVKNTLLDAAKKKIKEEKARQNAEYKEIKAENQKRSKEEVANVKEALKALGKIPGCTVKQTKNWFTIKKTKTKELVASGAGRYEAYTRSDVDGYPIGETTYTYCTSFQIIGSDGEVERSFRNINDFAEALVIKLNL
jgi:hypothetical protein